jgi:hypothetical protein
MNELVYLCMLVWIKDDYNKKQKGGKMITTKPNKSIGYSTLKAESLRCLMWKNSRDL